VNYALQTKLLSDSRCTSKRINYKALFAALHLMRIDDFLKPHWSLTVSFPLQDGKFRKRHGSHSKWQVPFLQVQTEVAKTLQQKVAGLV